MIITRELAQPILDKLTEVLENPVNIIDHEGIIVASTDYERIGTFHEGAAEAIRNRRDLLVYQPLSENLTGTREGVTLPLEFHGECIGAVGISGNPDNLQHVASIIKVAVISLIEQSYLTQQANYKRKIMDNWVSGLIDPDNGDQKHLREQAQFLNLELKRSCCLVLVNTRPVAYNDFSMYEQYLRQVVESFCRIQFSSYIGHGQYVFAVRAQTKEDAIRLQPMCETLLDKFSSLGQQTFIGVGKPRNGIAGYRQSYYEAKHSVSIVERLSGEKRIIYYFEQQIFRLLECIPDHIKQSFIDNYFENREIDHVLFETLQVYFNHDRHIRETAEALYIHRNTLIFRLNKVKDQYGLDPRSFREAVILQIVLYMLKFPEINPGNRNTGDPEHCRESAYQDGDTND